MPICTPSATAAKSRSETVKSSLLVYNISTTPLPFQDLGAPPVAVAGRTFKSSNYLAALKVFAKRVQDLKGQLPTEFMTDAAKELIRSHVGADKPDSEWLPAYHKVLDQIRSLPKEQYDRADAGETAEYLWSSAKSVGGTELCSVLNAAIRADDPANIMHAVVLSCGINARRLNSRTAPVQNAGVLSLVLSAVSAFVAPNNGYPSPLAVDDKDVFGHATWLAGPAVAHGSWRGTGFRDEHRSFFKPGKKFRVPGVLATALDKGKAVDFLHRADQLHPRVLWCVKVDARGLHSPEHRVKHAAFVHKSLVCDAVVLGTGSYAPREHEFLYAAYSAFEVEAVLWAEPDLPGGKYKINTYHRVVIRAAKDNKDAEWPEDLELSPWY